MFYKTPTFPRCSKSNKISGIVHLLSYLRKCFYKMILIQLLDELIHSLIQGTAHHRHSLPFLTLVNKSINQSLEHFINQMIDHWIWHSVNQLIIQSINRSINQPTNQSINQWTNRSIRHLKTLVNFCIGSFFHKVANLILKETSFYCFIKLFHPPIDHSINQLFEMSNHILKF